MAANVVTINVCSAEHMVKIGLNSMLYPRLLENTFPLSAPSAQIDGLSFADVKNGLALQPCQNTASVKTMASTGYLCLT